MKLTSTNVTLIANEEVGMASLRQNSHEPMFMKEEYLEELRNLINDYLEMKNSSIPDECHCNKF